MRRQAPASRCRPRHLGCNRNQLEYLQQRVELGHKEARLPHQRSKGIEVSRIQKGPETRDPGAFSLLHVSASHCIILPHILAFSVTSLQHDRGGHLRDQPRSNWALFGPVPREGLGWLSLGQMPNPASIQAKLHKYGNHSLEVRSGSL